MNPARIWGSFAFFVFLFVWHYPTQKSETPKSDLGHKSTHLEILQADLEFGEKIESSNYVHTATIRNSSNTKIYINQISTNCLCTKCYPTSFALEPNSQQKILLTIDLSKARENGESLDDIRVLPIRVGLMAEYEIGSEKFVKNWDISGAAIPLFAKKSDRLVDFGVISDEISVASQTLQIHLRSPWV